MYECKIAERLVALREEKGVTQSEVARALSVSNKTVSKWENGMSSPDLSMLIGLSKYYGVSTDALLGLEDGKVASVDEMVASDFHGLSREEIVQKAYDVVKSIIPANFNKLAPYVDPEKRTTVLPSGEKSRSILATHDFFQFFSGSWESNVSVMLFRNKSNFSWMKEPEKQKKLKAFFCFLASEDALAVLHFVHSTACSTGFTADYVAKHTGLDKQRTTQILDMFCNVGECYWKIANLSEGEVKIYESYGDGIMLSVITLAYEAVCAKRACDYKFLMDGKMIGGEEYELVAKSKKTST